MNKTNRFLMAMCLLLPCTLAMSQTPPELKVFQEAAGNGSVLFRGKQATIYERAANGNPYWASTVFSPGQIIYEGNFYDDVFVNIDAVAGLALVRKGDNPVSVALRPETVGSIVADGRQFVGLGDGQGLPRGFYEVFGDGPEKVYKHVDKRLLTSSQSMNGDPIGYYDPSYNPYLNSYFAITKTYYFVDGEGRISRFRSKRDLLRKFPERRKEIRKAISAAGLNMPGVDFDTYCKELLKIAAR